MHLVLVCLLLLALRCSLSDKISDDQMWENFKVKYNKKYDSPTEEAEARGHFEQNVNDNVNHNMMDEHNYTVNINKYSDLHPDEKKAVLCGTEQPEDADNRTRRNFLVSERLTHDSWNWVDEGKVSPVKDQHTCGGCWSFAAVQALESQAAIKWGNIWKISEQQLIDCSGDYGNNGCNGGWPNKAFKYIINEGGVVMESCYPFTGEDGQCSISSNCYRFQMSDYVNVGPIGDEDALAEALAENGPLAVSIHTTDKFMHYGDGIYHDDDCDYKVDHSVLLVGYGTEDGQDYWLIKNSWGKSWGYDGYMKFKRNYNNMCKIASYASYPVLA